MPQKCSDSITKKELMKRNSEKGQTLIEFALVAFIFFIVIFAVIEMERMLLVYTTVANSARAGVRYAIVHGHDRTGSGANGPSTPTDYSNVVNVVKNLAGVGALDTGKLTVTVNYIDGSNAPGSRISVKAVYPYDPFTALPLSVNLGSLSEGVITF
jgi:Flp pilus assembly protein TadG